MKISTLILIGWTLVCIGLAILSLPHEFEGSTLLTISPGHGFSVLDSGGVIPLLIGAYLVLSSFFRKRKALYARFTRQPTAGLCLVFFAGLGLGLVLASIVSTFFWWWVVGALILASSAIILTREVMSDAQ